LPDMTGAELAARLRDEQATSHVLLLSSVVSNALLREAVKAGAEEKKETKAGAPSAAMRRKLNFKDKHALETLPKTIAKLQAEIAKQQRHLDDPNLYQKNRKKFDTASDALTKAQKELEEAEDKWLELEVLREEIEQA